MGKDRIALKEQALMWSLRCGNKDALRNIYDLYKNDMMALALSLSDDKSIAEDIVHDVFVAFARLAPDLRLRSSLKSYLFMAVANRIRSLQRRRQIQRTVGQVSPKIGGTTNMENPAEAIMISEQLEKAYQAIQMLPFEQREIIVMRLQCGLKFRQIAEVLGTSTRTVLSRYRYALIKLRSQLYSKAEQ